MAYHVKKTWHNGYRCGCCYSEWEDDEWVEGREEALNEVPVACPEEDDLGGLREIQVIDGSTGETIAEGELVWTTGHGQYSGYKGSRWSGHKDGVPFSDPPQEEWDKIIARVKAEKMEKDRQQLVAKVKEADKEAKRLGYDSLKAFMEEAC